MKCVIAFGAMSEVVFLSSDDEFSKHMREMAEQSGYFKEGEEWTSQAELNATAQFFIPISHSQSVLCAVENGYSSITCGSNHRIVFHQFSDLKCMAVNGDGEESEEFLLRKLHVFQRLVALHFGPVIELLKASDTNRQRRLWQNIGHQLDTWVKLCSSEQAFLVECIERVQVRQELNEMCISLLETALERARSLLDQNAVHAWLLVDTKLLALYSSKTAPELHSTDMLLITALVKSHFLYNSSSVDESFSGTPSKPSSLHFSTPAESVGGRDPFFSVPSESPVEEGDEDEQPDSEAELPDFHTPISSPVPVPNASSPSASSQFEYHSPYSNPTTPYGWFTPRPLSPHFRPQLDSHHEETSVDPLPERTPDKLTPASSRPGSARIHSRRGSTDKTLEDSVGASFEVLTHQTILNETSHIPSSSLGKDYYREVVFLRTVACQYAPHTLHFVNVLPGTVLVIITTASRSQVASLICQSLSKLPSPDLPAQSIIDSTRSSPRIIVELLENNVRRLMEHFKKSKEPVRNLCKKLQQQWEQLKRSNLQRYLELDGKLQEGKLEEKDLSRVESAASSMGVLLRELFQNLFCNPRLSVDSRHRQNTCMFEIKRLLHDKLKDWHGFLRTKALRNMPMTTYWNEFPGLIHFIYIDRTTDQAVVPTLNTEDDRLFTGTEVQSGDSDPGGIIKEKVWTMCRYARTMLRHGYTSVAIRDGDFLYSYLLWFEDPVGNHITAPRSVSALASKNLPGILAGNFYKDLIRQCFPSAPASSIHCYELLCLHIGVVPTHFVAKQARRLSAMLWDQSGANSPFSLI